MICAYLRVSSDKKSVENQRYEILKFADKRKLLIDHWIEETVSGTRKIHKRKLGGFLESTKTEDTLIVSELSRLGRNLMDVMSILHGRIESEVKVFTVKEHFQERSIKLKNC